MRALRRLHTFLDAAQRPERILAKIPRLTPIHPSPSVPVCACAAGLNCGSNWEVEEYIAERRRQGTLTFRDRVYQTLASPASSLLALFVAAFLLIAATASVVLAAVQMSEEAHDIQAGNTARTDYVADWIFTGIFGIEIIIRAAVYVKPWTSVSLWGDVVCFLPLVMRLYFSYHNIRALELEDPARSITILVQALASLRLLKLTRYSSAFEILRHAVVESSSALWIPFYLLCVLFTFVGGIVYAFEYVPPGHPDAGDGGRVTTVLEAWWMLLVTMVTVGYGDYSPRSDGGRFITAIAMCIGLCFTAMPLAIVGNTFSTAWEARSLAVIREQLKRHLLDKGLNADNCEQAP